LVYFVAIWYVLCHLVICWWFIIFSSILVCCSTKKIWQPWMIPFFRIRTERTSLSRKKRSSSSFEHLAVWQIWKANAKNSRKTNYFYEGPSRVARWFVFKPKIQIWVTFGGSCNGRCWHILWTLGRFYGLSLYFMDIWYSSW
jgi:hypothetical protein